MTTIKVKFRPSSCPETEGTIYYLITHQRNSRQISTGYYIFPEEWNEKHSTVIPAFSTEREPYIRSIRQSICRDKERLIKIVHNLNNSGIIFSIDEIVDEFKHHFRKNNLFNFMQNIITGLKENGKIRTAETYKATINSFRKFLTSQPFITGCEKPDNLTLDAINSELLEAYQAWLRKRNIVPNTISFYNRILRAVYNRAVERGIIENQQPFRHVYTGIDKTVKRALPLPIIKKIKDMDLSKNPAADFARDMFTISFMLRGMSLIDMAFLKKTDLCNGYITYRRRKTGQLLTIKWTTEMQAILNKYPTNKSIFLLPIIKNAGVNERYAYRNAGYNINHNLKTIAKKVGITIPLTLYVARHSWASAAKSKGIPLSVISEGMGHDSMATTQIYLAALDTTLIDQANSLILSSL